VERHAGSSAALTVHASPATWAGVAVVTIALVLVGGMEAISVKHTDTLLNAGYPADDRVSSSAHAGRERRASGSQARTTGCTALPQWPPTAQHAARGEKGPPAELWLWRSRGVRQFGAPVCAGQARNNEQPLKHP